MNKGARIRFLLFGIVALCIVLATSFTGIFWDNVSQIYNYADWLSLNGLFNFEVPDSMDIGIPLTVPFLHAAAWEIFGKSLLVSHLLMWPFVWGLLWQIFRLVDFFVDDKQLVWWVFALVLADPTFCAMLTLINYEVIQYFLFFGAVNAVLRRNATLKTVFLFFLSIVSFRSMMLCVGVFLFDAFMVFVDKKNVKQLSPLMLAPYVVGALPAIGFLMWHYLSKGWIFGNPDSPWAECWTFVDAKGFVRNIAVLVHRLLDFGRVFLWIALFVVVWINRKSFHLKEYRALIALWLASFVLVAVFSLFYNNPMGHRYFTASYVVFPILLALMVYRFWGLKKWFFVLLIGLLLSGNFWLYPRKISQGWDASLAHLPYWHLRHDMIRYMDTQGISFDETASFFPNDCAIGAVDLNGDGRTFVSFDGSHKYVFYSNVYNLTDEGYDLLDQKYDIVRKISFYPVDVILYRLKE